jgi:diphthine-ammonia ligase
MKVFGLLSGGKDGCFGLLKCVEHGHEVVAVGNLHPPANRNSEEMDSFMYQTVGTTVVASIAQCIGVPLMSREIRGKAMTQGLDYVKTEDGDEVEDLFWLLVDAKKRWPEIEAVSNGALLSTYQRHRVENVCARLGLVSLAYLWQYDQAELVTAMGEQGLDAIIAKVASLGLKPAMLGKRLQTLFPQFQQLNEQFGFHVAGEGGEYESLALACPGLFQDGYRVVIDDSEVIMHEDAMYAPVAYLQVNKHHAECNGERQEPWIGDNHIASTTTAEETISMSDVTCQSIKDTTSFVTMNSDGTDGIYMCCSLQHNADVIVEVGNVVTDMLTKVQSMLKESGACMADVVFAHLYLGDMSTFATANESYCKFFGNSPPSRACVEVPLPPTAPVFMRLFVVRGSSTAGASIRQVLHVRSYSEWAPVCIGPYSQCNSLNGLAYCAGQIALIPAAMQLLDSTDLLDHVRLSLRHCDRILQCSKSVLKRAVLITVYTVPEHSVKKCTAIVSSQLEQDYGISNKDVALVVVQVPRLPRDAPVEVQVVALSDVGAEPPRCDTDDDSQSGREVESLARANSGFSIKAQASKEIIDACKLNKCTHEVTLYFVSGDLNVEADVKSMEESIREMGIAFCAIPVLQVEQGAKFVCAGLRQSWS